MSEPEIGFENAKVGDRCYSPLFKSVNPGEKTNCVISEIEMDETFPLIVRGDTGGMVPLKIDGSYGLGCDGQVLFWENPIKEIPVRPKRMVIKKGYIGVMPIKKDANGNMIAIATDIYETDVFCRGNKYKLTKIEFEVEE